MLEIINEISKIEAEYECNWVRMQLDQKALILGKISGCG